MSVVSENIQADIDRYDLLKNHVYASASGIIKQQSAEELQNLSRKISHEIMLQNVDDVRTDILKSSDAKAKYMAIMSQNPTEGLNSDFYDTLARSFIADDIRRQRYDAGLYQNNTEPYILPNITGHESYADRLELLKNASRHGEKNILDLLSDDTGRLNPEKIVFFSNAFKMASNSPEDILVKNQFQSIYAGLKEAREARQGYDDDAMTPAFDNGNVILIDSEHQVPYRSYKDIMEAMNKPENYRQVNDVKFFDEDRMREIVDSIESGKMRSDPDVADMWKRQYVTQQVMKNVEMANDQINREIRDNPKAQTQEDINSFRINAYKNLLSKDQGFGTQFYASIATELLKEQMAFKEMKNKYPEMTDEEMSKLPPAVQAAMEVYKKDGMDGLIEHYSMKSMSLGGLVSKTVVSDLISKEMIGIDKGNTAYTLLSDLKEQNNINRNLYINDKGPLLFKDGDYTQPKMVTSDENARWRPMKGNKKEQGLFAGLMDKITDGISKFRNVKHVIGQHIKDKIDAHMDRAQLVAETAVRQHAERLESMKNQAVARIERPLYQSAITKISDVLGKFSNARMYVPKAFVAVAERIKAFKEPENRIAYANRVAALANDEKMNPVVRMLVKMHNRDLNTLSNTKAKINTIKDTIENVRMALKNPELFKAAMEQAAKQAAQQVAEESANNANIKGNTPDPQNSQQKTFGNFVAPKPDHSGVIIKQEGPKEPEPTSLRM